MARSAMLLAACVAAAQAALPAMYDCAKCRAVLEIGEDCKRFDACHLHDEAASAGVTDCVGLGVCGKEGPPVLASSDEIDLRVTKGFGTKAYDAIRISVVTQNGNEPRGFNASGFEYSAPFKWRWTDNSVHTSIVSHPRPGSAVPINVGGTTVDIALPAEGEGIAGVIIGDPCFLSASFLSEVACVYARDFGTKDRTPKMLNAIMKNSDANFWAILGDNFYDRKGHGTREVYTKLDLQTKTKLMMTVPGNHDYWVMGEPSVGSRQDQFSYGFMQWYNMDSKAAQGFTPGNPHNKGVAPFNLAVDPSKGSIATKQNLPPLENAFWYQQVGNVGFVGYSGAYSRAESLRFLAEACEWLGRNKRSNGGTIDVAVLFGHWDVGGLGSDNNMAVPEFYDEMATLAGCRAYNETDTLKFFMGHTHCNQPHPHGRVNVGFMVAGQGMGGCGNYGFPILDTTQSRVRVWYFEAYSSPHTSTPHYDEIHDCISAKGWRACTQHATLWIDQPIRH